MPRTSSEGEQNCGSDGFFRFWGYSNCPRCDIQFDKSIPSRNPLREGCGHVWCRGCYKVNLSSNPDGCLQCDNAGTTEPSSTKEQLDGKRTVKNTETNDEACDNGKDENWNVGESLKQQAALPGKKRWKLCFDNVNDSAGDVGINDDDAERKCGRQQKLACDTSGPGEHQRPSSEENQTPSPPDRQAGSSEETRTPSPSEDQEGTSAESASGLLIVPLRTKNLGTGEEAQGREAAGKAKNTVLPDHITVLSNEGGLKVYKCGVCSKQFKTKANIRYHSFCGQDIEKPFKCETCGKGFVTKSHFEYHVRFHTGERPFQCNVCGKGFSQVNKLNRHKACHSAEKKFKCRQCNNSYSQLDGLKLHCSVAHNTGQVVRRYVCQVCSKRFHHKATLLRHVAGVHESTRIKCNICSKGFDSEFELQLHSRVHDDNVRRYKCESCGKTFIALKDLARHELIHSPDKPWKCSHCAMAFKRKDHLDRHERQSHKDKGPSLPSIPAGEVMHSNTSLTDEPEPQNPAPVVQVPQQKQASVETSTPIERAFCPPLANSSSASYPNSKEPSCTEVVLQSPPITAQVPLPTVDSLLCQIVKMNRSSPKVAGVPQSVDETEMEMEVVESGNLSNRRAVSSSKSPLQESVLEVSHVSMDSRSSKTMSHKRICTFVLGKRSPVLTGKYRTEASFCPWQLQNFFPR